MTGEALGPVSGLATMGLCLEREDLAVDESRRSEFPFTCLYPGVDASVERGAGQNQCKTGADCHEQQIASLYCLCDSGARQLASLNILSHGNGRHGRIAGR